MGDWEKALRVSSQMMDVLNQNSVTDNLDLKLIEDMRGQHTFIEQTIEDMKEEERVVNGCSKEKNEEKNSDDFSTFLFNLTSHCKSLNSQQELSIESIIRDLIVFIPHFQSYPDSRVRFRMEGGFECLLSLLNSEDGEDNKIVLVTNILVILCDALQDQRRSVSYCIDIGLFDKLVSLLLNGEEISNTGVGIVCRIFSCSIVEEESESIKGFLISNPSLFYKLIGFYQNHSFLEEVGNEFVGDFLDLVHASISLPLIKSKLGTPSSPEEQIWGAFLSHQFIEILGIHLSYLLTLNNKNRKETQQQEGLGFQYYSSSFLTLLKILLIFSIQETIQMHQHPFVVENVMNLWNDHWECCPIDLQDHLLAFFMNITKEDDDMCQLIFQHNGATLVEDLFQNDSQNLLDYPRKLQFTTGLYSRFVSCASNALGEGAFHLRLRENENQILSCFSSLLNQTIQIYFHCSSSVSSGETKRNNDLEPLFEGIKQLIRILASSLSSSTIHFILEEYNQIPLISNLLLLLPTPLKHEGCVTSQSVVMPPPSNSQVAPINPFVCGNVASILMKSVDWFEDKFQPGMEAILNSDVIERCICLVSNCNENKTRQNAVILLAKLMKCDPILDTKIRQLNGIQMMMEIGKNI